VINDGDAVSLISLKLPIAALRHRQILRKDGHVTDVARTAV
jgi:hypothetical protein